MPQNSPSAKYFEDLRIWSEARELVRFVYTDFSKGTASTHDFAFRDQISRAAISIMNNVAEGFERSSDKDFIRFLDIAKASCGEVRSMYYIAEDLNYVLPDICDSRRSLSKKISSGIGALQRHLKSKINSH